MNIYEGSCRIESIQTVARETKKFQFRIGKYKSLDGSHEGEGSLDFQAGQFISLKFTDKAWRAYSIASTAQEELIELVIRIVPGGVGSTILDEAKVDDEFTFKAPFGHFVRSENRDANLIFLGTGTGIAPLRSMIIEENRTEQPRSMKLFYGGRNADDIAYLDELEQWAPEHLTTRLGFSRDENATQVCGYSEHCRITKFIEEGDFNAQSEFYICGNGAMVKSVQEILEAKGVEKNRIFMERFN